MTEPPLLTLPVLVSYAYGKDWDLAGEAARAARAGVRLRFMADSGAFTAHTTGRKVSLDGYASWLDQWGPELFGITVPSFVLGFPWMSRFAAFWRTIRDPAPPPPRGALPGPTLYLAVADLASLHLATTTAANDDVLRDLTGRSRQLVS